MCFKQKNSHISKEIYKKKIQEFNQNKWKEPIDIEELVFSSYDESEDFHHNELVFINSNYDMEWLTSYELSPKSRGLISDIMVLKSLPYKHLSKKQQLSYLRILGQGVVAGFAENEADVKNCIEQANSFHKTISIEAYKKHLLTTSTIVFVIGIIGFNLVMLSQPALHTNLFIALLWGFIGAYISICYKTGKKDESLSINKSYILVNTFVRFILGMTFGVIALYLVDMGFINLGNDKSISLPILALAAGFSEKLIPNILEQYENKFSKGNCPREKEKKEDSCQSNDNKSRMSQPTEGTEQEKVTGQSNTLHVKESALKALSDYKNIRSRSRLDNFKR